MQGSHSHSFYVAAQGAGPVRSFSFVQLCWSGFIGYSAPCPKAGLRAWEEPTLPHDRTVLSMCTFSGHISPAGIHSLVADLTNGSQQWNQDSSNTITWSIRSVLLRRNWRLLRAKVALLCCSGLVKRWGTHFAGAFFILRLSSSYPQERLTSLAT